MNNKARLTGNYTDNYIGVVFLRLLLSIEWVILNEPVFFTVCHIRFGEGRQMHWWKGFREAVVNRTIHGKRPLPNQ